MTQLEGPVRWRKAWGREESPRGELFPGINDLLPIGFPQTTLAVLFVTYCGVQLVKERERTLALEEEREQDKEKPE